MNKRQFILIGAILGGLLIILIIITAFLGGFSKEKQSEQNSQITPIPRSPARNSEPKDPFALNQGSGNLSEEQTKQLSEIRNRSKNLTKSQKINFDRAKSLVPVETNDFAVGYSEEVDQFIVSDKTDNANMESNKWIQANGLTDAVKKNPSIVAHTDLPLDEYLFLVDKFADDPQNLPSPSQSLDLINEGSSEENQDVRLLTDAIKGLINLNFPQDTGTDEGQPAPATTTSSTSNVLEGSLQPISSLANNKKNYITNTCGKNIDTYKRAESITGVSWPVLAAIHYREATCQSDRSLANGSKLQGSLLDSAVFAANHLKGKIGGKIPSSLEDIAKSAGRYNGTGNRNCGVTPYGNCPPKFENDDHNYAMAQFDGSHETMYIVYCRDGVRCNPPKKETRPGATTVVRLLTGK